MVKPACVGLGALICAAFVTMGPLAAHAQHLMVVTSRTSLNPKAQNSSSYIEVTMRNSAGAPTLQHRCQPNELCLAPVPEGTTSASSRLVYSSQRERLITCNGEPVTTEGAPCERADGILTATTQVRIGKLKITAKPDTGFSGLLLNTTGSGVKLEFVESAEDSWFFGYSNPNFQKPNQYQNVPVGQYRVLADDLPQHCKPTQTNTGMTFTVKEYTSEEDRQELVVLFRGNACQLKVVRTASAGASVGTVTSTPAGLDCAAGAPSCEGTFPFDTQVTLQPSGSFSWMVAQGCVPTTQPCTLRVSSDRTVNLNFEIAGDGGVVVGDQDAGLMGYDMPGLPPDAAVAVDADSSGPVAPTPSVPAGDAGLKQRDTGCGCAVANGAGGGAELVWLLAMAVALAYRRRRG